LEKDLENVKIELAVKDDFNLIDGFGLLDHMGKGFVTPTELRDGLRDLGFRPNLDELHLLF
jgi:Ca2+-binding EF-hand superfamily protein